MNNHGGARPGAGRPEKKEKVIELMVYVYPYQLHFLKQKGNVSKYIRDNVDKEIKIENQQNMLKDWNMG